MRQIANIAVLCGLLIASLTGRVIAKEAMVGLVGVELVLPTNFCELDPTQSSDAQVIARYTAQLARSGIQVLSISAACSELRGWRAGVSLLDHLVLFSTDARFISQPPPVDPETMRKQICDKIRAQATQAIFVGMAKVNHSRTPLPGTSSSTARLWLASTTMIRTPVTQRSCRICARNSEPRSCSCSLIRPSPSRARYCSLRRSCLTWTCKGSPSHWQKTVSSWQVGGRRMGCDYGDALRRQSRGMFSASS